MSVAARPASALIRPTRHPGFRLTPLRPGAGAASRTPGRRLPPCPRADYGPSVGSLRICHNEGDTMRSEHAVAAGTEQATAAPSTGLRRGALLAYRWAVLAFLLAGVAQIFLAGLGAFRLQDQGLAAAGDSAFAPHRALGFGMAGIALLILVLAVIARPGARAVVGSAVLVLLTSLM